MSGDLTKLAIEHEGRIETGPIQFNDDWPGVFFRGDVALMALRPLLKTARDHSDPIWRAVAINFLEMLDEVQYPQPDD